jgi:hypothetical protein
MSRQAQLIAQADERAKVLARMSDEGMAEAYSETLLDSRNLNLSPYLVTAVRDLGLWPRLVDALAKREEASR